MTGPRGPHQGRLDLHAVEAHFKAELQAMQAEAADWARYAAWQRSPEGQAHLDEWIGGGPEDSDRDVEFYTAEAQHAADGLALVRYCRALRGALDEWLSPLFDARELLERRARSGGVLNRVIDGEVGLRR